MPPTLKFSGPSKFDCRRISWLNCSERPDETSMVVNLLVLPTCGSLKKPPGVNGVLLNGDRRDVPVVVLLGVDAALAVGGHRRGRQFVGQVVVQGELIGVRARLIERIQRRLDLDCRSVEVVSPAFTSPEVKPKMLPSRPVRVPDELTVP
jgi:hypothetical protein